MRYRIDADVDFRVVLEIPTDGTKEEAIDLAKRLIGKLRLSRSSNKFRQVDVQTVTVLECVEMES